MLYIPVLKNRVYENKFLRENTHLFEDESIIPLIEIINLKGKKDSKDVLKTVEEYSEVFTNKYFIDFFTFDSDEYKNFDTKKVGFSLSIRNENEYRYYEDLLLLLVDLKNAIPVLSIKTGRDFVLSDKYINKTIKDLQTKFPNIAVRIQAKLLDEYFGLLDSKLRDSDYLMYDIAEEAIESKYFDIEKINGRHGRYKMIIISSPRSPKLSNNSFPDGEFTNLIDNSLRIEYKKNGFDGFGDHAGLKNVLPAGGSKGLGSALGLFYVDYKNKFFSVVYSDSSYGIKGYNYVIGELFNRYYDLLNPKKDCPAFEFMSTKFLKKNSTGNWAQWNYVTILRYISQIKKSTSDYL